MKRIIYVFSTLVVLLIIVICIPYIVPVTIYGNLYTYKITRNDISLIKYHSNEANIIIPDKILGKRVRTIEKNCFYHNYNVKYVKISNSIEIISDGAFAKCINLKNIEFGKNVYEIGTNVFSYDIDLNNVILNKDLKVVGELAFLGCTNLKEITIPSEIETIGTSAFCGSGLENVNIPSNMEYIGESAFSGTPWLERQEGFVICGDHVLLAYNGDEKNIVVPQGVKFLSGSFEQCENLENVYIPETVTYIGDYTFLGSDTGKVYIPASVTMIGTQYGVFSRNCEMTIVTTEGSYAEQYAKEEGMKCEIVDEIPYPYE